MKTVARYLHLLLVKFINTVKAMLNLLDKDFIKRFQTLEQTVEKLFKARQPYIGDWYDFSEALEYVTTRTLQFKNSDIDPRTQLQVGDPIRWKHGGDSNWRYGYVSSTSATQFKVTGGSDYTLAATDPVEFSRGLTKNPIGHPILFSFDPAYNCPVGGVTYSILDPAFANSKFLMVGKLLKLKLDTSYVSITGGASPVHATPPLQSDFLTYERQIISAVDNFSFAVGLAKMGGANLIEIQPDADFSAGGAFTATANGAGWNVSLEFTVDEDA